MKNHREISGILANVLIVVAILLFIVFGLNKIGVYDLPDVVEKIIGTYNENGIESDKNGGKNIKDAKFDGKKKEDSVYVLSYENARELLEKVSAVPEYSHKLTFESYYNSKKLVKNVSLSRRNKLYSAYVMDENGRVEREIIETANNVTVISYDDKELVEVNLEKGNFDISDECGFVLTVDSFLNSGFELDKASFLQFENDYGTCVRIEFNNTFANITQSEVYEVSLDFGVVTMAECYEDDVLVFSMKTSELKR